MLVSIGGTAKAKGDLVDLLLDCHVRIRTFVALAESAGTNDAVTGPEVVAACLRVERYFAEALPLHVRDEEDSLLPRLRGLQPAVDAALADMHRQHREHTAGLEALLASCRAVRAHPEDRDLRKALGSVASALRAEFELHLVAEETVIFPAIRSALPAAAQAGIMEELRARRQGH